MKRFFALCCVVSLAACGMFATETGDTNTWKAEKNEECADFNRVKVFQTLDNGALAMVCDSSDTKYCSGMVVALKKSWDLDLWDEKVVTPPKGKCFTYDGTYKYETNDKRVKTIPILGFGYQYSSKSADEAADRLAEMTVSLYFNCKYHFETGEKSLRSEGLKLCECYKQATTDILAEWAVYDEEQKMDKPLYMESFGNKMDECAKKYPNAAKAY